MSDLDRIWEMTLAAFEAGEVEPGLERLSEFVESAGACAETSYLFGVGALLRDDLDAAARSFADAHGRDGGWPEPLIGSADTAFRARRLDDAARFLAEAAALGPLTADGHALRSVLAEFRGDEEEAAEAYAAARSADPEGFPPRLVTSPEAFHGHVEAAVARLPARFSEKLQNLAIVVEALPSMELLGEGGHDPEILGLYVGTPLTERSHAGPADLPDVIYLFQRNLERASADLDTLISEIAITVYHEIAHAFGLDEDEVEEMGLG